VAVSSGAYRTILTHFSQRYPKIPAGIPAPGRRVVHGAACFTTRQASTLSNTTSPIIAAHKRLNRVGHGSLMQAMPSMRHLYAVQARDPTGSWLHLMVCACRWRSCSTCRACCRLSLQPWSISRLQMPRTLARHCDVRGQYIVTFIGEARKGFSIR
jgi:hypothetical protein